MFFKYFVVIFKYILCLMSLFQQLSNKQLLLPFILNFYIYLPIIVKLQSRLEKKDKLLMWVSFGIFYFCNCFKCFLKFYWEMIVLLYHLTEFLTKLTWQSLPQLLGYLYSCWVYLPKFWRGNVQQGLNFLCLIDCYLLKKNMAFSIG